VAVVEVIEYSLVVLTSLFFAGFGVYFFTGYAHNVAQSNSIATFSRILSAAWSSIGSDSEERVVVFLNNVTLACKDGNFSFVSGSTKLLATIPTNCDFTFGGLHGIRTLVLRDSSGSLTVGVE